MAAPFVEGRLRKKRLVVEIETECAHCQTPIHLTVGSDLKHRVAAKRAKTLVFEPAVDWQRFNEPNITHAY
jgi:hypothetical protein